MEAKKSLPPLGNYRLGDPMTPAQQERALKALAKGYAIQQAFARGLSREEVERKVWLVEVHPLDPEPGVESQDVRQAP